MLARYLFCIACSLLFSGAASAVDTAKTRAEPASRSDHQMFKGVELYSWKDAKRGTWRFALLPGTNRNKSVLEIMSVSNAIEGEECLKKRLAALAVGEHVVWQLTYPELSFPPAAQIREIQDFAIAQRLELVIAR